MKTSEITDGMVERTAQKLGCDLDLTMVRADGNGRARLGDIELMLTHEPGDLMGYDYETDAQTNLTRLAKDVLGTALCEGRFEVSGEMVDRAIDAFVLHGDCDATGRCMCGERFADNGEWKRHAMRRTLNAALNGGDDA